MITDAELAKLAQDCIDPDKGSETWESFEREWCDPRRALAALAIIEAAKQVMPVCYACRQTVGIALSTWDALT